MKAVIFDLFGTLILNLDSKKHDQVVGGIADLLEVPADRFREEWGRTFVQRMDGTLQDSDEMFLPMVERLQKKVTREQLVRASELRRNSILSALVPRPGALECLEELVSRGYQLALATDCSSETPSLLDRTPLGRFFSVRACSAHLRVRKPHPAMYEHVLNGLRVDGSDCLYVGDGNSEELPGAKQHGMTTVWVDNLDDQRFKERFVPNGDHRVEDLREILEILS